MATTPRSEMRILTVRQPWAWAIIHGGKDVENRVRNIAGDYRGPVAIHAAKGVGSAEEFMANTFTVSRIGPPVPFGLTYGAILGVVDLAGVHLVKQSNGMSNICFDDHTPVGRICSPWAQNYIEFPAHEGYHLVLTNPRPLAEPIPYRGALGLRRLDDDTTARILTQIGEPA
ncbi:hypothetical protein QE418_000559 [Microbacterium testaceum]|uniref:ASCH domain-containing protein n=1 Tax=Microbacterium TaxID=33882 RepID=UPI00278B1B8C|nr:MULTISPECIES: ASCH domain-containing protein [Microbacterium]MDQ1111111.1 hypothetical protein [Microbacterium testaceum]MDR6098350.1 hypothetical protein [Microbacterium sp. SORGH_AS_0454]